MVKGLVPPNIKTHYIHFKIKILGYWYINRDTNGKG